MSLPNIRVMEKVPIQMEWIPNYVMLLQGSGLGILLLYDMKQDFLITLGTRPVLSFFYARASLIFILLSFMPGLPLSLFSCSSTVAWFLQLRK